MKFLSRLSLRGLFILIVGILLVPALLLSSFGYFQARAQEAGLDQVRSQVNQINQETNESITSPYYMSPRTFDPCNPALLSSVSYPENWQIVYRYLGNYQVTCTWTYYKDLERIAVDGWNKYDRKLAYRQYYQNSTQLLATDNFFVLDNSNQVQCVKQRQYSDYAVSECYSEAGFVISIDPVDKFFSPLPPMLYWFAYR